MRVALYARYSSDQQRAASIADQLRTCREFAGRLGLTVVADYHDAAVSGASLMRAGIQSLMRDAAANKFDVVLAEALDRFSRDQEDIAHLAKQLKFARVKIRHRLGRRDHRAPHRAEGHDERPVSRGSGREDPPRAPWSSRSRTVWRRTSFGYRVVRVLEGQPRGEREIIPAEAAIVQRIFRAFVAGVSPKAIAKALNAEGLPGPRGRTWSPSTIHGHAGRGTGILNNELYIGRTIWNRQRFEKNPDTGKRVARLNPTSEWITKDVPDLRIVADSLWQAAKARQASTRYTMRSGIVRARRPKYLFSGLTRCESCDGGFGLSSHDLLTCFNARSRGTCQTLRSIKRQDVEARVLRAMRERLFDPGVYAAFRDGFMAEMTTLRREHLAQLAGAGASPPPWSGRSAR